MADLAKLRGLITTSGAETCTCERCNTSGRLCFRLRLGESETEGKFTCSRCFDAADEDDQRRAFYLYIDLQPDELIENFGDGVYALLKVVPESSNGESPSVEPRILH